MTLRKKIFYDFSIFTSLLILIVGAFNCLQTFRLLRENMAASIKMSLTLGINSIDYYLQDTNNLCSSILVDSNVQHYLSAEDYSDDFDSRNRIRELMRLMTQYASTRSYITKIYFITARGFPVDKDIDQAMVSYIDGLQPSGEYDITVSGPHRATYTVGENQVISLVMPVYESYKKQRVLGRIVADIDYRTIHRIITGFSLPIDNHILLIDDLKNTLMIDNPSSLSAEDLSSAISTASDFSAAKVRGKKFYNIVVPSDATNWALVCMIPKDSLLAAALPQLFLSIFLVVLSIMAVYLMSVRLVRYIYRPLNLLRDSMKAVEEGDLTVRVSYQAPDEFATVVNGYNSMIERVRALLSEVQEKEALKRDAEIYALQAQISPHFLYNSLNSIRYYAKSYHADEIYQITVALIQLAQASLSSERFITIRQELDLTEQYLVIQKIRYGDVFHVSYEVDNTVAECLIPRFSIQPVVENALFHGLLPKGVGSIFVSVKPDQSGVSICIADDGIGMPGEDIRQVNEDLERIDYILSTNKTVRKLKNIGLENINYRIRTYYSAGSGGVHISARPQGTLVEIRIPEQVRDYETGVGNR